MRSEPLSLPASLPFWTVCLTVSQAWASLLSHLTQRDEAVWSDCVRHLAKALTVVPTNIFSKGTSEKEDQLRPVALKRLAFLVRVHV